MILVITHINTNGSIAKNNSNLKLKLNEVFSFD